jgi:putative hydrolase of the HAD superfamily
VTYKAILFDLGKVLVHFDFKRAYQRLEGICPHAATEIPRVLATTGIAQRFETGLMEPAEFVAEITRTLNVEVGYPEFCDIFSCIFTETLVPESLVETLAARYRLVLLSNTNAIHFDWIRSRYPILRHFHHLVLSYEVKAMKPRPEIYEAAVAAAGCRPEECFYTDDIAEFVEGARRVGIDAVQFQGAAQLEHELRARGIL